MQFEVSRPRRLALAAFAAVALTQPAAAAQTAQSFEGVWKLTRIVRAGPKGPVEAHPQGSLLMFHQGYYSVLIDYSPQARKPAPEPKDPARPTDAEKIAKYDEWAPYVASAGTYEVIGERLITHNVVAKQAKGMTKTEEVTFKLVGDRFVARAPGKDVELTYTRVR
jgi:hypothetical protein